MQATDAKKGEGRVEAVWRMQREPEIDIAAGERARLVRLCALLSADADAAEDLAQETLLEAWRNAHKLRDPSGRWAWLSAIARNVCMRHGRVRGRDRAHLLAARPDGADPLSGEREPAGGVDLEIDLERGELADLLDRAMALLPPETRAVLVERYVRDTPQAEAAAKLDLSEGALAVRLHRGKLALRRLLSTELRAEAESYGLYSETDALRETRIWCPVCGRRRLLGRIDLTTGELALKCPDCTPQPGENITQSRMPELLGGTRSYRVAVSRVMEWADESYRRGLVEGAMPCLYCGRRAPLRTGDFGTGPADILRYGFESRCRACGGVSQSGLVGLVWCLPAGRRFWGGHERMRTLPTREIEAEGRPALVTGIEAIDGGGRLDVVSSRDKYEVIAIHER
jgi:RNA polymerase sigma-70 factor (ECF subfamily)